MACNECKNEKLIDVIFDDLKEIKSDIKAILRFKWSLIAVISFISFICSGLVTIFFRG